MKNVYTRLRRKSRQLQSDWRLVRMANAVARHAKVDPHRQPVIFFNASTRLTGMSQSAAFQLLTAWSLRLAGVPVVHFVCDGGMRRCVLGTNPDDHLVSPPCDACVRYSKRCYHGADVHWFSYSDDAEVRRVLTHLSLDELCSFEHQSIPLGEIVLPSLRWTLRRHHLPDDEATRFLMQQYILSAWNVACKFGDLLERVQPAAAVVFNGIMYPEAIVRWIGQQRGVRVITHEVSFQPFSAFFTDDQATAYPIEIPTNFQLSPEQNARLDAYLEQRFQGKFTMAGIRFWPQMRGLDESFLTRAARFKQIVPVFTNVVYDTSQVHASVIFPHMFAWLDLVLDIIREHPETLFVIRAHPDEKRPGTRKQSRESVEQWVRANAVDKLPNVVFIDSQEYISSYELIQRSKFVMVYNSSIGLEAILFGVPVLCAGKARFTQYPTVFFPQSPEEYHEKAERFLTADAIKMPEEFQRNARRFLYYQLFRASLPFNDYLRASDVPGYVTMRPFHWRKLLKDEAITFRVLVDGILHHTLFLLPE